MRDAILNLFKKRPNEALSARKIAHFLDLSSEQHKALRQELRSLLHEGKLILDREQHYCLRDENRVLRGQVKLHPEGFGFLIPEEKGRADVFIPQRHMNFALNGDTVLVESRRNSNDGRFEGRVIQIIKHVADVVIGAVKRKGDMFFVIPGDRKLGLAELYVPKKALGLATEGDYVAARIVQFPGPGIVALGEVINVIGVEVDAQTLKEAILLKHGVQRKFLDSIHREVGHLPAEVDAEFLPEGRVDLRELPIITIDGITARDFDDAVCVQTRGRTTILWVSIADVAEYVRLHSELDKEAFRRGTSTYFADECVPMLPEKLSNGLCSLNPHVPRYTLTAEIHYNNNAEVMSARFYKSVIRSHKRATYDEVQSFFDGVGRYDFSEPVCKSLLEMKSLAEKLMQKTESRGAMSFDLPEPEFIFGADGKIKTICKRQRFFAHKLIEQFMIAANVVVAELFTSLDFPLLYRIHESPDSLKVQNFMSLAQGLGYGRLLKGFHPADFFRDLQGDRCETFLQSVFLRSLKQAVYSPDNAGHFGLALQDYAHFTSPIRRYPDLVVHRQLRSLIEQVPQGIVNFEKREPKRKSKSANPGLLPYTYRDLLAIGQHTSQRERAAMEAERDMSDMYRAFFMRDFLRQKFHARITRVNKFGLSLELDPHFVEGFLPMKALTDDYYVFDEKKIQLFGRKTRRSLRLGDSLWVEVADSDPTTSQIVLELAGEKRGLKLKSGKKKT